jgi:hypothetical protein
MVVRAIVFACGIASTTIVASRVEAQDTPTPTSPRHWSELAIVAHLGVGTPYGGLGGAIDWAPLEWWVMSAGGGVGAEGPQWAAMTRLRDARGGGAFGVGFSGGPYHTLNWSQSSTERTWSHAVWANAELSLENDPRNAYRVRGYFGIGVLLNQHGWTSCSLGNVERGAPEPCSAHTGPLFYLGLSFGGDVFE